MPSMRKIGPVPFLVIAPQTIIYQPPSLTVDFTHMGSYSSPILRLTYTFRSKSMRLNIYSSVKMTLDHCFLVQLRCSSANDHKRPTPKMSPVRFSTLRALWINMSLWICSYTTLLLFDNKKLSADLIFQVDNDPKYTSSQAKQFLQGHNVTIIKRQAQSLDLNPIEMLRVDVQKEFEKKKAKNLKNRNNL